jgi:hypothetical protein
MEFTIQTFHSQVAQVESHLSHWLMGVLKSPRAQLKVQMPPIMM